MKHGESIIMKKFNHKIASHVRKFKIDKVCSDELTVMQSINKSITIDYGTEIIDQ